MSGHGVVCNAMCDCAGRAGRARFQGRARRSRTTRMYPLYPMTSIKVSCWPRYVIKINTFRYVFRAPMVYPDKRLVASLLMEIKMYYHLIFDNEDNLFVSPC